MKPNGNEGAPPKQERLKEFFRRLEAAEPASTFDAAYELLCTTLVQVEDDLSGLPNEPDRWMTLDRMFPPQTDRMSSVEGCDVKRFDSLRHITYIAMNGAIEIRSKKSKNGNVMIHYSKPGKDGRNICQVCSDLTHKNL